jgi:hypothetical protein
MEKNLSHQMPELGAVAAISALRRVIVRCGFSFFGSDYTPTAPVEPGGLISRRGAS